MQIKPLVQKLEPALIKELRERFKGKSGSKTKGKEVVGVREESGFEQPGSDAKKPIKLKSLKLEPENDSEKEICAQIKQKAHYLFCFLFTFLLIL